MTLLVYALNANSYSFIAHYAHLFCAQCAIFLFIEYEHIVNCVSII